MVIKRNTTGCQTWTRTKINGTKNRCPTIRRSDNIKCPERPLMIGIIT